VVFKTKILVLVAMTTILVVVAITTILVLKTNGRYLLVMETSNLVLKTSVFSFREWGIGSGSCRNRQALPANHCALPVTPVAIG